MKHTVYVKQGINNNVLLLVAHVIVAYWSRNRYISTEVHVIQFFRNFDHYTVIIYLWM